MEKHTWCSEYIELKTLADTIEEFMAARENTTSILRIESAGSKQMTAKAMQSLFYRKFRMIILVI